MGDLINNMEHHPMNMRNEYGEEMAEGEHRMEEFDQEEIEAIIESISSGKTQSLKKLTF
jgi:hypothetical protein